MRWSGARARGAASGVRKVSRVMLLWVDHASWKKNKHDGSNLSSCFSACRRGSVDAHVSILFFFFFFPPLQKRTRKLSKWIVTFFFFFFFMSCEITFPVLEIVGAVAPLLLGSLRRSARSVFLQTHAEMWIWHDGNILMQTSFFFLGSVAVDGAQSAAALAPRPQAPPGAADWFLLEGMPINNQSAHLPLLASHATNPCVHFGAHGPCCCWSWSCLLFDMCSLMLHWFISPLFIYSHFWMIELFFFFVINIHHCFKKKNHPYFNWMCDLYRPLV